MLKCDILLMLPLLQSTLVGLRGNSSEAQASIDSVVQACGPALAEKLIWVCNTFC